MEAAHTLSSARPRESGDPVLRKGNSSAYLALDSRVARE